MPDKFKSLCCKEVGKTIIFKRQQTKKIYDTPKRQLCQ